MAVKTAKTRKSIKRIKRGRSVTTASVRTIRVQKPQPKKAKVIRAVPVHREFEASFSTLVIAISDQIKEQKISRIDLAKKARVCPTTVYRLNPAKPERMTRSPHLRTIWSICRALGWTTLEMSCNPDLRKGRFLSGKAA